MSGNYFGSSDKYRGQNDQRAFSEYGRVEGLKEDADKRAERMETVRTVPSLKELKWNEFDLVDANEHLLGWTHYELNQDLNGCEWSWMCYVEEGQQRSKIKYSNQRAAREGLVDFLMAKNLILEPEDWTIEQARDAVQSFLGIEEQTAQFIGKTTVTMFDQSINITDGRSHLNIAVERSFARDFIQQMQVALRLLSEHLDEYPF